MFRSVTLACLVAAPAAALVSAAVPVREIQTSLSWTWESDQANAEAGYSVAPAGDVNGDGYSDVLVGAWRFDNPESNEGRAFLFLGTATGLAATPAWTAESNQPDAYFGFCVAPAGDVNGDGFHDVIIGAPFYDNGHTNEGRAFLYLGSASGLGSSPVWIAEIDETDAQFGASLSTAGDVNGDGFADVIVGARFSENGQSNEGRAFVYHGSASGLSAAPVWSGEGNQAEANFAWSVASAGDVNADGYADVIVGAMGHDGGEGAAFVYHGSASGLSVSPTWTGQSVQASSAYGWSVSLAGDVDGDGFGDVLVGAPSYDNGETNEGRVFVYRGSGLGLAPTPSWTFEDNQAGEEFGYAVATAGDMNGDGFAEIVVGAASADDGQTNEGAVMIYRGSASGPYFNPTELQADHAAAFFGASVATAGDVNGDGLSDLIVGAWGFENSQTNEGRAYGYLGSADFISLPEEWAEGNQAGASLGWSVATAGDVNGDGFADVIVGAPFYENGQFDEGRASLYLGSSAGLGETSSWTAEGGTPYAYFGFCVASAGDVNGDGFADVVVGAPTGLGTAFLFLGSASGLASSPAWTVEGQHPNVHFGSCVATAGDVNGDGFSDVLVAGPGFAPDPGRAYLFLGSASGLATSAAWTVVGDPSEEFARSVASAGDVNGDGFSDVIVGGQWWSNGSAVVGRALVYFGSPSGLSANPGWAAEGEQSGESFGHSVASAGDVNGDGYSDILVGAPAYDGIFGEDAGRAYLFLGSFAGPSLFPWWTMQGGADNFYAGRCVSGAGDANGDGFSDAVIMKTGYNGSAGVFHGSPSGLVPAVNFPGPQAGADFGWSAGTAGDVNGDGFSDFVIGAPSFDGNLSGEGVFLLSYGNGGVGLHRLPAQVRSDGSVPIVALCRSDSPSAFRLEALGRMSGGRGRVRMQYEVEEYGDPFDGAGVVTTTPLDTGIPAFGEGSAVEFSQLVGGLNTGALYRWRMRFLSSSLFFPRTPWFYLAANGRGEADLRAAPPLVTGVAEVAAINAAEWLEPGLPNPFAAATRLAYSLPHPGRMRLSVFDVSGRRVALLADGVQDAGRQVLTWDGRDENRNKLAAGVYFARLEFDGRAQARKLILVR